MWESLRIFRLASKGYEETTMMKLVSGDVFFMVSMKDGRLPEVWKAVSSPYMTDFKNRPVPVNGLPTVNAVRLRGAELAKVS